MGYMNNLDIDVVNGVEVEDLPAYLLVNLHNANDKVKPYVCNMKPVFFTVNPSDEYWLNKNGLVEERSSELRFRSDIIRELGNIQNYYRRFKQLKLEINIHFEKSNRLHAHGVIIGFGESYYGYDYELDRISKKLHKYFGKPKLRNDICAKLMWCNSEWDGSYLVKQNYLKPCYLRYE